MLLLEDCGESLDSYDGLTPNQRCVQCLPYLHPLTDPRASLFSHVSAIHRRHVCHQDLEPRNVVMSASGQLRVVDFELSDRSHQCVPQDCEELQGLAWETKGGPLRDVTPNRQLWFAATVAGVIALVYLLVLA
jgi:serine/threonine protein kinase